MAQYTHEYKNSEVAQREIALMSARGYRVISMTNVEQRVGCMRILLLGIFAFAFKPKPHVLVAYEGESVPVEMVDQSALTPGIAAPAIQSTPTSQYGAQAWQAALWAGDRVADLISLALRVPRSAE